MSNCQPEDNNKEPHIHNNVQSSSNRITFFLGIRLPARRKSALDTMLLMLVTFLTYTSKTTKKVINKIYNTIDTKQDKNQFLVVYATNLAHR